MTTRRFQQRLEVAGAWLSRRSGPTVRLTRRQTCFDAALALALAAVAVRYAVTDIDLPVLVVQPGSGVPLSPVKPPDSDARHQAGIVAVGSAAALAFRRRFPLAVLWVVSALTLVSDEPGFTFYALVIASYSAAAYSPLRVLTGGSLMLTLPALLLDSAWALPIVPTRFVPIFVLVSIVVAADGMRRWKQRVDESRSEVSALKHAQTEAVRLAAAKERERIARELHDVVTHNVSVMVIQAGAARKVMLTAPEQARDALLAVESGGRAALGELRQVMGLLGESGDEGADDADRGGELVPQPGLDRLPALLAQVRDAGLRVELTVTGLVRAFPPGVELAAYRVVQEGLTNTLKHASGASAGVAIDYGADRIRVEVVDSGGAPGVHAAAGGRGLAGLRDRLGAYGGTLEMEPRLTGGHRLTAEIPVERT